MMTGYSIKQLLDQAVQDGAWGVIHKPVDIEKVLEMLARIRQGGILIVDDDSEFVEFIKELLESNGYVVFVAEDGKEAIERIQSNGINVLILDLRMPILGGLEAYMELRNLGYNIPTIIVTAYARGEKAALDALQALSITGILSKPFDPEDLLRVVEISCKKVSG